MGDYGKGSGPPHFDWKNYKMWEARMGAFLRGKGKLLWNVTIDTNYVIPDNFFLPGSSDMFEAVRLSTIFTVLSVHLNSIGCLESS